MITLADFIKRKSTTLYATSPYASVYSALEQMNELDTGALLVYENGRIYGVFSERDYARKVVLDGKSSKNTYIFEVMQTEVIYLKPEETLEDCLAVMAKMKVRHLPVIDDDMKVWAFLSIKEVAEAIIDEKEYYITQLINFVNGSPVADVPAKQELKEIHKLLTPALGQHLV